MTTDEPPRTFPIPRPTRPPTQPNLNLDTTGTKTNPESCLGLKGKLNFELIKLTTSDRKMNPE